MTYEESVRAISLGRELASPQQARVQKFGLENITVLAEALGNPQRASPASTSPARTAKVRRPRCSNRFSARRACAPGFTLRRILKASTSASARRRRNLRSRRLPPPGREFAPPSNRSWPPASSPRIPLSSSASPRWPFVAFAQRRKSISPSTKWARRPARRHEYRRPRSRGHHADRFRPRKFPRPFHRRNRRRKGRHHQARRMGRQRHLAR